MTNPTVAAVAKDVAELKQTVADHAEALDTKVDTAAANAIDELHKRVDAVQAVAQGHLSSLEVLAKTHRTLAIALAGFGVAGLVAVIILAVALARAGIH